MYGRMCVHATYKMPYGPQDINKRPYALWPMVFIKTIKKQNILLDWKKFTYTSKNVKLQVFYITDYGLRTDHFMH